MERGMAERSWRERGEEGLKRRRNCNVGIRREGALMPCSNKAWREEEDSQCSTSISSHPIRSEAWCPDGVPPPLSYHDAVRGFLSPFPVDRKKGSFNFKPGEGKAGKGSEREAAIWQ